MEYYIREKLGWQKPRANKYAIFCVFESVPEYASVRLYQTTETC